MDIMGVVQDVVQQVFGVLVPAIVAAVGLLVTFALAKLAAYLDQLKRNVGLDTDERIARQAVTAIAQIDSAASGGQKLSNGQKLAGAVDMVVDGGVSIGNARRVVEKAVSDIKQDTAWRTAHFAEVAKPADE